MLLKAIFSCEDVNVCAGVLQCFFLSDWKSWNNSKTIQDDYFLHKTLLNNSYFLNLINEMEGSDMSLQTVQFG